MRKFLASILVLFFIPLFVFTLLLHTVLTNLLDENFLKGPLRKTNAYERLLSTALPEVIDQMPKDGEGVLSLLGEEETKTILVNTIKPSELQDITENTIDNVIAYLNFESEEMELKYNLSKYKNNFSANFENLLIKKVDALPTCTGTQLQSLEMGGTEIPECKPSGQTGSDVYRGLNLEGELINSFPDEVVLTKDKVLVKPKDSLDINPDESPLSGIDTVRENISNLLTVRQIGFISLAIMILFIILLRLPSWRSIFSSVGWAFLLGGFAASLISLIIKLSSTLTSEIATAAKAPKKLSLLAGDIGKELTNNLTGEIFIISVPIFIVGIVLIGIAFFSQKRSDSKTGGSDQ